jgi:two-component system nitrogen regulation response regulator GlnG/two-component system response regulator HydG
MAGGEVRVPDDTTITEAEAASSPHPTSRDGPVDALVVVHCADDPGRIGEALLLPPPGAKRPLVFGRGDSRAGECVRALLVRQRPGANTETAPLESSDLSRSQLLVRSHPDGGIAVDNVGKRPLVVEGQSVTSARVRAGTLLEVGRKLALLATRRPPVLPPMRAADSRLMPGFGEADAFGYVGESPEAWRVRNEIAAVAMREEHVLLFGESGSGKELVAQAIHALGPRSGRRIVARNAATLPSGLIDAEFFGSAANYPNAGMPERPGLVGEANGSTLFLDEIGELPIELQAHLLRLLDGGDYQRLGDARRRTADLRLVAATNRPAHQLKGDFAARFAIRLHLPNLNDRRCDVPLVARHLLRSRIAQGAEACLSRQLTLALVGHLYTTNVRELASILLRAAVESRGPVVDLTPGAREMLGAPDESLGAPRSVRDVPREAIVESLTRNGGVRERVWRELGLPNRYLLKRLMKKYGIRDDAPQSE